MEGFLNEYWDTIIVIGFNVLLILKMISLIRNKMNSTTMHTVKIIKALKRDVLSLNKKSEKSDQMLRILLNFVKDESEFKQINKLMPQELKDDYKKIKEDITNIDNEV